MTSIWHLVGVRHALIFPHFLDTEKQNLMERKKYNKATVTQNLEYVHCLNRACTHLVLICETLFQLNEEVFELEFCRDRIQIQMSVQISVTIVMVYPHCPYLTVKLSNFARSSLLMVLCVFCMAVRKSAIVTSRATTLSAGRSHSGL